MLDLHGREVRALSAFDGSLASTPISPTRAFAAITLPVRGLRCANLRAPRARAHPPDRSRLTGA